MRHRYTIIRLTICVKPECVNVQQVIIWGSTHYCIYKEIQQKEQDYTVICSTQPHLSYPQDYRTPPSHRTHILGHFEGRSMHEQQAVDVLPQRGDLEEPAIMNQQPAFRNPGSRKLEAGNWKLGTGSKEDTLTLANTVTEAKGSKSTALHSCFIAIARAG